MIPGISLRWPPASVTLLAVATSVPYAQLPDRPMTIERRFAVRFGSYIKHLVKIVLASSLALGLVLGVSIFLSGETSMNIDLTLDFDAVDGIWVILGLPVLSLLVFSLLSPLSFFIHGLISKRTREDVLRDA